MATLPELKRRYQVWLQELHAVLHELSVEDAAKTTVQVVETIRAYLQAGRQLTSDETALFMETFFREQQQSALPSLWPEALWQLLANVTDQTQVSWQELQDDLSHHGVYSQGETVGMGVYCCTQCGDCQHVTHPTMLLPCGCGGGRFSRQGLPV